MAASSQHAPPSLLNHTAFLIRVLFSEMGDCLLLKGQPVLQKRLIEAGYEFHHPQLAEALRHKFD